MAEQRAGGAGHTGGSPLVPDSIRRLFPQPSSDTETHGASPAATHLLPRRDRTAPQITFFTTILEPRDPLPPALLSVVRLHLWPECRAKFPPQVCVSFPPAAPSTRDPRAQRAQGGHFLEPPLQTFQPGCDRAEPGEQLFRGCLSPFIPAPTFPVHIDFKCYLLEYAAPSVVLLPAGKPAASWIGDQPVFRSTLAVLSKPSAAEDSQPLFSF